MAYGNCKGDTVRCGKPLMGGVSCVPVCAIPYPSPSPRLVAKFCGGLGAVLPKEPPKCVKNHRNGQMFRFNRKVYIV